MHGAYAITNDDLRYVLSTFVVVPTRWLERFGWRPLRDAERVASANYYRELGRHMNIKDVPGTYEGFAALLDAYEAEHFAFSPGGRAVADATLALLAGFYPFPSARCARSPSRSWTRRCVPPSATPSRRGSRGRSRTAACAPAHRCCADCPPRRDPVVLRELREFAIYPGGYRVRSWGPSRGEARPRAAR